MAGPHGIVAGLLLLLAAGCSNLIVDPMDFGDPPTDLQAAQERWQAQGMTSYQYDMAVLCYCEPVSPGSLDPRRIQVRDGAVVSVRSLRTGSSLDAALGGTIEDLFRRIAEAKKRGDRVEVEYHPQSYPALITFGDPARDAGMQVRVDNVRRVK